MAKITVEVNGNPWINPPLDPGDQLTFMQVKERAFPNSGSSEVFRILYDGAVGDGGLPVNGRLYPDESIKVRDGTKFTVSQPNET